MTTTTSKKVARPILLLDGYRSKLEENVGSQLERAGVPFAFESEWVKYTIPQRDAKYLPDFVLTKRDGTKIYIEAKGAFGFDPKANKQRRSSAEERQKLILIKEQHPGIDIRLVFSNSQKTIYKGSPTTYAKWAITHGFPWADKTIPEAWLEELKK